MVLVPGALALASSVIHAVRFTACLEEAVLPALANTSLFGAGGPILVGAALAASSAASRRSLPAWASRGVGWASAVGAAVALGTALVGAFEHDRDAVAVFGAMSVVAALASLRLLRATRHAAG